jgi:two-component system, chemotaxis family, CheB/CheR fusion protein
VNDELERRGTELDLANEYLESILSGIHRGVVVVDREVHIQLWNAWAQDLWGLRRDEVEGRHLANLDIGLPLEVVMPAVRHCLERKIGEQIVVQARNRRGFDFTCVVTCSPLGRVDEPIGVIIMMEELGGARDAVGEPDVTE